MALELLFVLLLSILSFLMCATRVFAGGEDSSSSSWRKLFPLTEMRVMMKKWSMVCNPKATMKNILEKSTLEIDPSCV